MTIQNKTHHPPAATECRRTRLAQSTVAAVDVCSCGMMQLHIGALTLRLTPSAVSNLWATLDRAITVHAGRDADVGPNATAMPIVHGPRGTA